MGRIYKMSVIIMLLETKVPMIEPVKYQFSVTFAHFSIRSIYDMIILYDILYIVHLKVLMKVRWLKLKVEFI